MNKVGSLPLDVRHWTCKHCGTNHEGLTPPHHEDELIEGALRISIGKFTTDEEIEKSAEILINTINQILSIH